MRFSPRFYYCILLFLILYTLDFNIIYIRYLKNLGAVSLKATPHPFFDVKTVRNTIETQYYRDYPKEQRRATVRIKIKGASNRAFKFSLSVR